MMLQKESKWHLFSDFVDQDGVVQERFFDMIHVKNTKALTLKNELSHVLSNYGFDVQNLRGQRYDGASNMKGEFNGLQALFLKECPYAYYVHCYAHRLQLALVAAAKYVVPVTQFFQHLMFIRVEIFRATIDTQLTELNLKFNEKVLGLLSISVTLVPKTGFASFQASEICKMQIQSLPADFNNQERIGLESQLKHFAVDASTSEDLKNISTLAELCRCLVITGRVKTFNLIERLLRLLLTLPVSTASAEHAFSFLKIIETRLRNKMEDEFLANSLLVHIEGEIARDYSYEDIISEFHGKKSGLVKSIILLVVWVVSSLYFAMCLSNTMIVSNVFYEQ